MSGRELSPEEKVQEKARTYSDLNLAAKIGIVAACVLNLLGTSVGLSILLHAWWIAVICLIGEALLGYLSIVGGLFVLVSGPHRVRSALLVTLLPIAIAWGIMGWFLHPVVSLQVHIPYSTLVLAAVGFLLGLFVNFFILLPAARYLSGTIYSKILDK